MPQIPKAIKLNKKRSLFEKNTHKMVHIKMHPENPKYLKMCLYKAFPRGCLEYTDCKTVFFFLIRSKTAHVCKLIRLFCSLKVIQRYVAVQDTSFLWPILSSTKTFAQRAQRTRILRVIVKSVTFTSNETLRVDPNIFERGGEKFVFKWKRIRVYKPKFLFLLLGVNVWNTNLLNFANAKI